MSPAVAAVLFVVPLVIFEMVLPEIVTEAVPASQYIPYTLCTLAVEAELALMLPAVAVLPMVLFLIVVVPDAADL